MNLAVFSIFDAKAEGFMRPFSSININTATRDFGAAVTTDETDVGKNPQDFTLFHIGTFDTLTGMQDIENPIREIVNGLVLRTSLQAEIIKRSQQHPQLQAAPPLNPNQKEISS